MFRTCSGSYKLVMSLVPFMSLCFYTLLEELNKKSKTEQIQNEGENGTSAKSPKTRNTPLVCTIFFFLVLVSSQFTFFYSTLTPQTNFLEKFKISIIFILNSCILNKHTVYSNSIGGELPYYLKLTSLT